MTDELRQSEPRRRRPRTPPGIAYSTVESVAAELHHVAGDGATALRSRLHHLRRMNFPDGVAAGSGRHFEYRTPDLLGLALALELAEAFVPPAIAVSIVRAGWPEFARAALAGWRSGASAMAVIIPNGLRPIAPGCEEACQHVELASLTEGHRPTRSITLDVGAVAQNLLSSMPRRDARTAGLMRDGINDVERRFGTGRALERGGAEPGRLGGDGPFWSRASSVLAGVSSRTRGPDLRRLRWFLDYLVAPAPVDGWKVRVAVDAGLGDVGFGAALAWACARKQLVPSRTVLPIDGLDRVERALRAQVGDVDAVIARLQQITSRGLAAT